MMTDQADNGGMAEFELLRQSAEAGDPDAQFTLGLLFQRGTDGIKAYRPSAIGWYFKAASQGHAEAQGNLGAMFLDEAAKKNSASDADKARNWLTKAASQGNVDAMYRLGLLLRHGYGIEAKPKSARSWFDSSAKGGNAAALTQLGSMSEEAGDAAAAAKFYGEGAEKGDASAQYNLARCLRDGIGVERDPVQSRKWFESAAEQDLSKAQYALGLLLLQDKKTTRSLKQAQRWFQQAATRGDADAQYENRRRLPAGPRERRRFWPRHRVLPHGGGPGPRTRDVRPGHDVPKRCRPARSQAFRRGVDVPARGHGRARRRRACLRDHAG
ncbi:MAG: tetratricopeptide repeat protein [Rhodospirillales bacterium]